jgi:hypothetical protein
MPKSTVFEVNRGGAWKRITVDQAIKNHELRGRCIECHKPVRPHRTSTDGMQIAHVDISKEILCSLSDPR